MGDSSGRRGEFQLPSIKTLTGSSPPRPVVTQGANIPGYPTSAASATAAAEKQSHYEHPAYQHPTRNQLPAHYPTHQQQQPRVVSPVQGNVGYVGQTKHAYYSGPPPPQAQQQSLPPTPASQHQQHGYIYHGYGREGPGSAPAHMHSEGYRNSAYTYGHQGHASHPGHAGYPAGAATEPGQGQGSVEMAGMARAQQAHARAQYLPHTPVLQATFHRSHHAYSNPSPTAAAATTPTSANVPFHDSSSMLDETYIHPQPASRAAYQVPKHSAVGPASPYLPPPPQSHPPVPLHAPSSAVFPITGPPPPPPAPLYNRGSHPTEHSASLADLGSDWDSEEGPLGDADEALLRRRKRNAQSAARLRERRKTREQELSASCSKLETQISRLQVELDDEKRRAMLELQQGSGGGMRGTKRAWSGTVDDVAAAVAATAVSRDSSAGAAVDSRFVAAAAAVEGHGDFGIKRRRPLKELDQVRLGDLKGKIETLGRLNQQVCVNLGVLRQEIQRISGAIVSQKDRWVGVPMQ